MRTLEDLLRKVLNARNIRSDEPVPGKMQRFFIPRIFSITLMSPSECVGGEVCVGVGTRNVWDEISVRVPIMNDTAEPGVLPSRKIPGSRAPSVR